MRCKGFSEDAIAKPRIRKRQRTNERVFVMNLFSLPHEKRTPTSEASTVTFFKFPSSYYRLEVENFKCPSSVFAFEYMRWHYMVMIHIANKLFDRELKKGSAGLLILSLIESRPRHGYEIGKLIEQRSGGALKFHVASLYPLLYRLEKRGLIHGRWVEKAGQRRRRFYRLTAQGRKMLKEQRSIWRDFVQAINLITGDEHA